MDRVLIVGAGIAGLSVAAELAGSASVSVVDRLPAVGGTSHYDHPLVRSLAAQARSAGAAFRLGTTALRWQDRRLLVASPGRIEWINGDHLVYAGGVRPATPAEMRLTGSRKAGLVSATVAVHLLEAQVVLGRRPVILGASDWAEAVAGLLHETGTRVFIVSEELGAAPFYADEWWPGWSAVRIGGHRRVEELTVASRGHEERITCDAIILADRIRPLRNVEGAINGSADVTFVQLPGASVPSSALMAHARAVAAELKTRIRRANP